MFRRPGKQNLVPLLPDVGQRAQKIDEPFLHRVHMGELVCLHDIDGAVRRHYLNAYAWEILLHLAQSRQGSLLVQSDVLDILLLGKIVNNRPAQRNHRGTDGNIAQVAPDRFQRTPCGNRKPAAQRRKELYGSPVHLGKALHCIEQCVVDIAYHQQFI